MRLVIQCVSRAAVRVRDEETGAERETGRIGRGYVVLLGVAEGDTEEMADRFLDKLYKLRVFPDENGKTNRSIQDIGGEVLVVSQFTLYADCHKGNRPSFIRAGKPELAERLYEYVKEGIRARFGSVQCGEFGAHMLVDLENDGPFTLMWDSDDWGKNA